MGAVWAFGWGVAAASGALLPGCADALPAMDPDTFERLLAELEGTPVLVNFWGSWCPPCKDEMPHLVEAHDEFGDRVQFLGVDIIDNREEARLFMEEFGMTFPSVFDPPDAIKTSLGQFGQFDDVARTVTAVEGGAHRRTIAPAALALTNRCSIASEILWGGAP